MTILNCAARFVTGALVTGSLIVPTSATRAADMTLRGASLFDNDMPTAKRSFASRNWSTICGREIEFDLRGNSELGNEPDYVDFLTQGVVIDYAIIAPEIAPWLP